MSDKKLPWYKRMFSQKSVEQDMVDMMSDEPPTDPSIPWVNIKGVGERNGQIQLEMDWNEAFVKYLRKHGYSGVDEEQIVMKYIATVHQDLFSRFKESGNEFE